jgi:diamine N-acetyltransferase
MIKLMDINADNFSECCCLEAPEGSVAPNIESLAEAWVHYNRARPMAIYNDDEMVGFAMLDLTPRSELGFSFKDRTGLWRLMIDEKHQKKGYGTEAMKLIVEYVKKTFGSKEMETSIVPDEDGGAIAGKLYQSLGFEFTGEMDEDERVMLLKIICN